MHGPAGAKGRAPAPCPAVSATYFTRPLPCAAVATRRTPGPDWSFVGWHYKAIHSLGPLHNRLLRVRAKGLDHVPRTGGALLAGNHLSYWDGILLQAATPRPVGMLVRREIMGSRFGEWFFGRGGGIPVDRDAKRNPHAFDAARDAVLDGRLLGIYPEGKRGPDPDDNPEDLLEGGGLRLAPAKAGVGRLALETGRPVIPVALLTDRFWPRERKLPDVRQPVYMNIGEPVTYEGKPGSRDDARRIADDVMQRVARLLDEAAAARDAGERWTIPRW